MKSSMSLHAALLAGCLGAGQAGAAIIAVGDDIGAAQFLEAGTSASGIFDLTGAFSPATDYNAPYSINSATATFYFSDDYDPFTVTSSLSSYAYSSTASGWNYYRRQRLDSSFDAQEIGRVSLVNAASNQFSDAVSSGYYYTYPTYVGYAGNWWDSYSYPNVYYTDVYSAESGYRGSWAIDVILDADSLADLAADGMLSFDATMFMGDGYFSDARLVADVQANPVIAPVDIGTVPEPASLALLGLGLAGLLLSRRR